MIERFGKGSWIVRYGFESLVGEDQYGWGGLAKQDIINEVLMLYWSLNRIWEYLMWNNPHKSQIVQQQYYWVNVTTITLE
jgi:hypothetical protein